MSSTRGEATLEKLAARLAEVEEREQQYAQQLSALVGENARMQAQHRQMQQEMAALRAGPAPLPAPASAAGTTPAVPTAAPSRRGLLRSALGAAAATVGAGVLLETTGGMGTALANGAEGRTTFLSNSRDPTVTARNSGGGAGVYGIVPSGIGVFGDGGSDTGVQGYGRTGVQGSGNTYGVNGYSGSGTGVYGSSSDGTGVYGATDSTAPLATAIQGVVTSASPGAFSAAVRGDNSGTGSDGIGVLGVHAGSGTAVYGGSSNGTGVLGTSSYGTGVYGATDSTAAGAKAIHGVVTSLDAGLGSVAVRGQNNGTGANGYGVVGVHAGGGTGVYGSSSSGYGNYGTSTSGTGVYGSGITGVYGRSTSGIGVYGSGSTGVQGTGDSTSGTGVYGQGYIGVQGSPASASGSLAGLFNGDVTVTGVLSKGGGAFKIDHPLAPATKYLLHSFVESPDMLNIYSGIATLDADGRAVVALPSWFDVLNKEVRYQLTPLRAAAPHLHIAQPVQDNRFTIGGGTPGLEVCWLVTGVRQDAWANAHRIPVEEDKPAKEHGYYLHPEQYGAPAEKSITALHHPRPTAPQGPQVPALPSVPALPAMSQPSPAPAAPAAARTGTGPR